MIVIERVSKFNVTFVYRLVSYLLANLEVAHAMHDFQQQCRTGVFRAKVCVVIFFKTMYNITIIAGIIKVSIERLSYDLEKWFR